MLYGYGVHPAPYRLERAGLVVFAGMRSGIFLFCLNPERAGLSCCWLVSVADNPGTSSAFQTLLRTHRSREVQNKAKHLNLTTDLMEC